MIRRFTCATTAGILVATLAALTGPPSAVAATAPGAVITKIGGYPVKYDESNVGLATAVRGKATKLRVDYSNAKPGTVSVQGVCGSGSMKTIGTSTVPDDATDGIITYPIDTTGSTGNCRYSVSQNSGWVNLLQISPKLTTSKRTHPSGDAFYPLITADSWITTFVVNSPATATIVVRNAKGRLVYSHRSFALRRGTNSSGSKAWHAKVVWNGRRTNGTKAPAGRYGVRIIVRSIRGSGTEIIKPLRAIIKNGRRPLTKKVTLGASKGRFSNGGGCKSAPQAYSARVWMNCAISGGGSGSYSRGVWRIEVPKTAKLLSWSIQGQTTGEDVSGNGAIIKQIRRPSSTLFEIELKLTGRRSFMADEVRLAYRYLK